MSGMGTRERILGALRIAAPAPMPDSSELEARINQHHANGDLRGVSRKLLAGAMERVMTSVRTEVLCSDATGWPALLADKLGKAGVQRLLLDPATAEGAALAAALPAGMQALPFSQPLEAWKHSLFSSVDAGFTVARSGIAATGTLVLAPDPGTPRSVSLVPPLHVALVYASTLHADLHAAMHAERWSAGMPTNLVLVSGPSKTSDIQQTLAYGAHGPAALWVVIIDDVKEVQA
ncbi:LUD domain-containing protein [Duganella sp. Root1480D1]|uniref:LutC/YkgG family protein n=1 Tax=Duganella sp. Root1480D1 TaxID=1736471 RepID=UPI0007105C75|nr:LUD domain-containing protein [Duganella sp. Root1480D1]KQZ33205.1 lactate utilization protein C [Duganella sp. Root1480D1]